ncbi:MAG: dicarboxylate/amino acid:cation symporter [Synechococcales cyanobacterium]
MQSFFEVSMNLSTLILVALGVGISFGSLLNSFFPESVPLLDTYGLHPLGQAFLRLVQFVVVPIVFSSLILGVTRIQNAAQVGRYVIKLLTIYIVTTAISLTLGMTVALLLQPGVGMEAIALPINHSPNQAPSLLDWLISLIPTNPVEALSTANLLQIIFSAALLGMGIQQCRSEVQPFLDFLHSIYLITEKTLSVILYVAPIGVFALTSSVFATQGLGLIGRLFLYVLGLFLSSLGMVGFYIMVLWILGARPRQFFRGLAESLSLGFGTASSNAVLPVLLNNIQENYGLRPDIASFAIPLGTAIKRDGAAILQGFNALFIAQIYHIPITNSLLTAIALSSFLISFSTPGVPGSALITMTTVLAASGLPLEGIAIVAGIDRITDGFKTVLNVVGNGTTAIVLSFWEIESSPEPLITPSLSSEKEG